MPENTAELTPEERFKVVIDTVTFTDALNGINVKNESYTQELTDALARFALTAEGQRKLTAAGFMEWRI